MASKKDNQLRTVEPQNEASSSITYANEVVATIAGVAANEVEGIAGMCNISSGKIGGKNKGITKGVKVEVGPEEVSCDLYVIIEYGQPIQKVAQDAQESVRRSLEAMTGLHVVRVDVHVQGVTFEKENNALTAGAKNARLTGGRKEEPKKEEAPAEESAKAEPAKPEPVKPESAPEAEPAAEEPVQPEAGEEPADSAKES